MKGMSLYIRISVFVVKNAGSRGGRRAESRAGYGS